MSALKNARGFFQDEIPGMKRLSRLIGGLLNACGLDTSGRIGGTVQFFIYNEVEEYIRNDKTLDLSQGELGF